MGAESCSRPGKLCMCKFPAEIVAALVTRVRSCVCLQHGRSQMQGSKNWILTKEKNANRFFLDSHWLEIWKNHLCPSMGPNGVDSALSS